MARQTSTNFIGKACGTTNQIHWALWRLEIRQHARGCFGWQRNRRIPGDKILANKRHRDALYAGLLMMHSNNKQPTTFNHLSVLITGGAGFIGSHLTEALVRLGARVTVIDNLSTGLVQNLAAVADDILLIRGDITDYATCLLACKEVDVIFHLAAQSSVPASCQEPFTCNEVNIKGTYNLLEAARINKVKKFIFSSSAAVYGPQQVACNEDCTPCIPRSPYGYSKLVGELLCRSYCQLTSLAVVCLRYFNVYGPRQRGDLPHAGLIALLRHRLSQNLPITLYGDGRQVRDFIHVAEVVRSNVLFGLSDPTSWQGGCFNIASGHSISITSVFQSLLQEFPAYTATVKWQKARPGDIPYSAADCSKYLHFVQQCPYNIDQFYDILPSIDTRLSTFTHM